MTDIIGAGNARLSLCMIVKNEEKTLERSLKHARPHIDEIVIVDTGSTDGTLDIAGKYADVLDEIEWPDSFSIARNHSLDLATGTHILVLDADEYIEDLPTWEKVRHVINEPHFLWGYMWQANSQIGYSDKIVTTRLFLNNEKIRYDGLIHELIENDLLQYGKDYHARTGNEPLIETQIGDIIHTGYALTPDEAYRKYKSRIELVRASVQLSETPSIKAKRRADLAKGLMMIGEHEESCKEWLLVDFDQLPNNGVLHSSLRCAGISFNRAGYKADAVELFKQLIKIVPKEPIGYFHCGVIFKEQGNHLDSLKCFCASYLANTANPKPKGVVNPHILKNEVVNTCFHYKAATAKRIKRANSKDARVLIHELYNKIALERKPVAVA